MRIIDGIAMLCLVVLLTSPALATDPRLQTFLGKFAEFDAQPHLRADWLGPDSPFAPYFDKPFIDGLGERERALYGQAYSQGACRIARIVATVGFLNQYPFLTPAFEVNDIRAAFEVYILPKLDRDPSPCIPAQQERGGTDRSLPAWMPDSGHG